MNFLKRRSKKTTITVSDQTRTSRVSLSSGEGRSSQQGSTVTLRKTSAIGRDVVGQDYGRTETVAFENLGSIKDLTVLPQKNGGKHARFSDDTNQNNNLPHDGDRPVGLQGNNPDFPVTQQPREMTLLAHPATRLVGDVPSEAGGTPMSLYASVIKGDKAELKKIISANPELLDTPDNFGRTPLMYCVLADRLDCAKFLIKMGCKLDQVDNAGRSAIHSAAHKGSYKFLELLHRRGASIDIKDHDGQTALHLATRIRSPKCLEFLLRNVGPGMVDVPDNQSRTALHWSAAFNNTECVKLLIKYGINIAIPDADGKTPLHWAANNHDPSAVNTMSALLEKSPGVVNWQDYEGRTALHFAVADGNSAAVELLVKFKPLDYFEPYTCDVDRSDNTFRTALHWAAQLGNHHITKILLDAGAKNAVTDTNGATPFLYAASNNHHNVVEVMIAHDPKVVEQTDIAGRNALMWAAGKGANDVIRIVLGIKKSTSRSLANQISSQTNMNHSNPAEDLSLNLDFRPLDINKADNKVNTALHVAALNGKESSVELLLSHGARHDLQNHMNHTPIFGACEKGHLTVVKYLLDYNASITLVDSESRSPLHWAALGGHAEVCEVLIKEGLDVDVRDTLDRTPLHCAAFGGFINCMNLLLENGANVDLQDQEGRSALHWAAQSGHLDAAKLLFQYGVFPNPMEYTEERLTPLNHALQQEKEEVAQYLIEQGALSAEHIRNIAATKIQAWYRGYRVRKTFLMRKKTLMRMVELRSKKNRQKKRSEGQMSDDCGRRQENDDMHDALEGDATGPPHSDHIFNEAATKIQARYRGYRVRKTQKESDDKVMNEQERDDATAEPQDTFFDSNSTSKDISHSGIRDASATKIQALVRGFLGRRRFSELKAEKQSSEDRGSISTADTKASVVDVGHEDPDSDPISDNSTALDVNVGLPYLGNVETTDEPPHVKSEDIGTHTEKHVSIVTKDVKHESPADSSTATDAFTHSKLDTEDTTTSTVQPVKKETRKKKHKKRRTKPAACDTSSENDFREQRPQKTSTSTSPMSLRSAASSARISSETKPAPLVPTPPTAVKSEERKPRRRYLSRSSPQNLSQPTYPALESIGNEDNITGDSVSGLAYKRQHEAEYFFDDSPLPVSASPVVSSSPSLDLSEYVESLMKLPPQEKKLLEEHQRNRRDAFKAAIDAAIMIQRAWWRFLSAKKPDLRKRFLVARKRARRLERQKKNAVETAKLPQQDSSGSGRKSENRSPEKKISNSKQKKSLLPDISSNSASSIVREKSDRSSVASSSEVCSIGGTKTRRPKTVSPGQSSVYISVEKLEELSRVYGHPQVMRDLMIASGKPSTLSSFRRGSTVKVRPVTMSDKRSPYGTSIASSNTSTLSIPSSKSPRQWAGSTNKTRRSVAQVKKSKKFSPAAQSAPAGSASPRSSDSDYKIDVSRLPLQWQKLYGELQNMEAVDLRRKQSARFSYNIGNVGS